MAPIFMPWCASGSRHGRLYESMSRTPIRDEWFPPPNSSFVRKCALQSTSMPALHGRNVPNCRPMVDGGMSKCSAGACPPLGRRGAWQNPPCQFSVPSHNSGFSYLGVPAPVGMSDCYESMSRTTIRDRPLQQPLIGHSGPSISHSGDQKHAPYPIRGRNPERVGRGECSAGPCPNQA